MDRFTYITFGDDVPHEIEKVYNRMLRYEKYLIEQDIKHGTGILPHDPFLENIADKSMTPEFQAEQAANELWECRLELLKKALNWLGKHSPKEYKLIMEYYYTNEDITIADLAERYGISKQALSKRLATSRDKLRKFIKAHENKN